MLANLTDLAKKRDSISKQLSQSKLIVINLNKTNEIESYGSLNQYEIFHLLSDTFLIRKTIVNDEGGAFTKNTTELFFWDNAPFLFVDKTYASWTLELTERVIYFSGSQVIMMQDRSIKKDYMDVFNSRLEDILLDVTPSKIETNVTWDLTPIDDFLKVLKQSTSSKK